MERLEALKMAYLLDRENETLMREFFLELQNAIYKTIHKKKLTSLSDDMRDELVQTVLLEVHKRLENINNVLAYAQVVFSNLFFKAVRKQGEKTPYDNKEFEIEVENSFNDKFKVLDEKVLDRIKDIINALPPPNNILLAAKFIKKKKHKELAAELGVPINQIGVKTERAMKRFMKTLKSDYRDLLQELADHFDKEI